MVSPHAKATCAQAGPSGFFEMPSPGDLQIPEEISRPPTYCLLPSGVALRPCKRISFLDVVMHLQACFETEKSPLANYH